MPAGWQLVAFPLIIPWRPGFWSLPLFFPELAVGVLWQWPRSHPYRGRPLPAAARADEREMRHYAPGDLTQWRAYEEYAAAGEDVNEIVRALKGEPPEPAEKVPPFREEEATQVAWRLELMEAEQEGHLARVDLGDEALSRMLLPESWEDSTTMPPLLEEVEVVDPETARLRYFLWRREMAPLLGPKSLPLLLSRTSEAIFASLRREAGGGEALRRRIRLPGCLGQEAFWELNREAPSWQGDFARLLAACLEAATAGMDPEPAALTLAAWVEDELLSRWPGFFSLSWELEICGPEPGLAYGGEAFLSWADLGKRVIAL